MASGSERQMKVADITDPMLPRSFRIQRLWRETRDAFTVELKPADGDEGFSFAAGQFNMLYVFGTGEAPISISGNPAKPETLLHTIRAVGRVTKAIRRLKRGDMLGIRGPYGSHWPVEEAKGNDVVLAAGGIGLAPLRPVLYHLLSNREKYGRIVLLYGARTPQDLLYRRELERWRGRFDLEVEITVDTATGGWLGNVGVVTKLIPAAKFDPFSTVAMICGPEVMMRFTVQALLNQGVEMENVFISMERNMRCAVGLCGHCQFGPVFVCRDGPVFCYSGIKEFFGKREI